MERILHLEQYLIESKSSEAGNIAISKFLKSNLSSALPETLTLLNRCKNYQIHHKWMQDNYTKLKQYDVVDTNGKGLHEKWIKKLGKMYEDESSMKE